MNTLYDTLTINVIVGMISMAICFLGAIYVWAGASVDRALDRIYLKAAGMLILFGVSGILRQVFSGQGGNMIHVIMHISCFGEFFLSSALIYVASVYLFSLFPALHQPLKKTAGLLLLLYALSLLVMDFYLLIFQRKKLHAIERQAFFLPADAAGFGVFTDNASGDQLWITGRGNLVVLSVFL